MAEQYNLLAEFGRVDGATVYLARDRATGAVAIARRRSDDPTAPLAISHVLDATVPADGAVCPSCIGALRSWGRFCPTCGREVFGAPAASPDAPSPTQLLDAVRHAAEGRFDVLGSIPRVDNGDTIYFAVDLTTADVVALRLAREGIEADGTLAYSLDLPLTLSPVIAPVPPAPAGPKPTPSRVAPVTPPAPIPAADSFTAMFGPSAPPAPPPPVAPVPPVVTAKPVVADPPRRTTTPIPLPPEPPTPVMSPPPPPARRPMPKRAIYGAVGVACVLGIVFVALALRPKAATPPAPAPVATADTTPAVTATDTAKPAPAPVRDTTIAAAPPPAAAPAPAPKPKRKPKVSARDTVGLSEAIRQCSSATLNNNWTTAAPVCERAADSGDPDAELSLGMMYQRGSGVPGNPVDAAKWFRKAADQGSARAMNYLGWAYANGDGIKRDGATAVKWFQKSADAGNAQGEYGLGMMYNNGAGAMRNDSLAIYWFRRAAAHGEPLARTELTRLGATP